MMDLFYTDVFELPLPAGHRFPMAKYRLLRDRIAGSALNPICQFHLPPAASDDELLLAHSPDYLLRVVQGSLSDLEQRRIGFPWSEKMVERSRRSTGASIAAAKNAMRNGLAANLAGGTHHASRDQGQGFCVFNDAAVAARVMLKSHGLRRIMVVDCDVHQGNGTAEIARDDASLFTFSIHCNRNYPFCKSASDLDIELPPGTADAEYLNALTIGLQQAWKEFAPELVFYLAGADPYEGDRLGQFNLTKPGLRLRDELVIHFFRERQVPLSIAMAGGYAPNIDDIVDIHFTTIEVAAHRLVAESNQK